MALAIKKRTVVVLVFHLVILIVTGLLFSNFWFSRDNQVYVRQRMNAPINQTLNFTLDFEEAHFDDAAALLERIQRKDLTPIESMGMDSFSLSPDIDISHLMPEGSVLTEDVYVFLHNERVLSTLLSYNFNGGHYYVSYGLGNDVYKQVTLAEPPSSNSKVEIFTIRNCSLLVEYVAA